MDNKFIKDTSTAQDEFCLKHCEIGKQKTKELLANNNSAYDAALDFFWFVEKCKKTCPHRKTTD
jgi:hypothetical protein